MNELMIFEGNEVEIILGENNEPLFELYSTGEALGYVNKRKNSIGKEYVSPYKSRIDKTVKSAGITCVCQGVTQYLTEEQLYDFMLEARTEKCKAFRKWVTQEVLPQIRQTGGYIPIQQEDSEEEIMAKALLIAQKTIEKKNELIKNLQPKADWFDKFMNSDGLFTSTQIAKMINYPSAQKLNKELNELKICYKKGKNWIPYANVDETWYKVLTCEFNGASSTQLKFTPIGVFEICKLLDIELKEDILG